MSWSSVTRGGGGKGKRWKHGFITFASVVPGKISVPGERYYVVLTQVLEKKG